MAVYTLHNNSGDYLHAKSISKQKMIDACNSLRFGAKVCEEYLAPSPWDKAKITKHAREIYNNKK